MDSQRRWEREAFIDWGARGQTGKCYGNLEIWLGDRSNSPLFIEYNGQTVKTQKGFDKVDSQKIMVLNILDASRVALEGYCNPPDRAFDLLDY